MGTLINDFPESCAFAGIRLVRHLNYFIIRYYCPTFLCLCGSFCGFWVATNGWPGRIICTCVVYLTIKSISETAYEEVPSNDVVSLFWWLWVIQAFIYMNLVEYAWALAWVQFAEDKVRARVAGRVCFSLLSLNYNYYNYKFQTCLHYRKVQTDTILARKVGTIILENFLIVSYSASMVQSICTIIQPVEIRWITLPNWSIPPLCSYLCLFTLLPLYQNGLENIMDKSPMI